MRSQQANIQPSSSRRITAQGGQLLLMDHSSLMGSAVRPDKALRFFLLSSGSDVVATAIWCWLIALVQSV
jgi:hypothetical protein